MKKGWKKGGGKRREKGQGVKREGKGWRREEGQGGKSGEKGEKGVKN